MSSLHQDHLLAEGSEPATGSAPTLAPARRTSRRPAAEKATSTVPPQRQGTAQRSGSTRTTTDAGETAPRTRRATGAKSAGSLASRAKAAGTATRKVAATKAVKAAAVTAVSAKAGAARAATAARATAAAKAAARGTTARPVTAKVAPATTKPAITAEPVPPAKPTTAKPATAKATAPAKAKAIATASPAPVAKAVRAQKPAEAPEPASAEVVAPAVEAPQATVTEAPRVRPTPHKRTVPAAQILAAVAQEAQAATTPEAAEVGETETQSLRTRLSRLRPPAIGRRPGLYLAAGLISALSLSAISSNDPTAQATDTMSHSVSVAEELGIEAAPSAAITDTDAAQLLGELAVSRNARDADQAAAAQAQAEADRVAAEAAAEAARPKAVLPVQGARLTSQFGARWGTLHAGIDLAAPMQTPEYAAMDGVVLEAGPASGYGLAVYIQHENGDVTVYGHMDSILVQAGQVVRAGDTIALLGNRGQSTGPHLHFEVRVGGIDGEKIDPIPWLRDRGVQI